jgi:cell division septum initiation protein DivIVA
MENFDTLRSNNSDDVMKYLGEVMNRLSQIEGENSLKDRQLYNFDLEVKRLQQENLSLRNQVNYYKQIEATLNNSMNMIRSTGEQIRNNALKEREVIIADAKNNASRILNDALMRAEKVSMETDKVKKDLIIYKNKVRSIIECQLEMIDDIEKIDI